MRRKCRALAYSGWDPSLLLFSIFILNNPNIQT